jgi:Ca2+-binding RTX toxin-like protein
MPSEGIGSATGQIEEEREGSVRDRHRRKGRRSRASARARAAVILASAPALLAAAPVEGAPLPPGQILVTDYGAFGGDGGVISVDPFTGRETKLSANDLAINSGSQLFLDPYALGLSPAGPLLVVDDAAFGGGGGVISVDPATGKEAKVSANDQAVNASSQLFDLALDLAFSGGQVLVTTTDGLGSGCGGSGCGGVVSVDPATGKETEASGNDQPVNASSQLFVDPYGVAVRPGGQIVVADYAAFSGPGGVIAVDPVTGAETDLSSNDLPINSSSHFFATPVDLTVAPSGRILVADYDAFGGTGGVISVDPATGKETKVSANDMAVNSGSQLFVDPNSIAISSTGQILISDRGAFGGTGGVISVDPATGKETKVSANDQAVNASSQLFDHPTGLATVPGIAARCQGRRATIVGTKGPDQVRGTARADVIAGLGGRDVVRSLGGDDRVCGGDGGDRISGGRGRDRLSGEKGNDALRGNGGADRLLGGGGNDALLGGPGRDRLAGGSGRDNQIQ